MSARANPQFGNGVIVGGVSQIVEAAPLDCWPAFESWAEFTRAAIVV